MIDFPPTEDLQEITRAAASLSISPSEKRTAGFGIFPSVKPTTKEVMNRDNHSHELIVSGIHLELTPALKTFVHEKAQRLFRHEERIVRMRVELECDPKQDVAHRFSAKGHISIHGPDLNATVASNDCYKAVSLLIDKLDRMLSRRAQLHKVKRNHPHAVELAAELPKAI
jgi:putative sigma-54 modulation protein